MKGFNEDANYSIGLLDDSATPMDVINNYIYEHTLVSLSLDPFLLHLPNTLLICVLVIVKQELRHCRVNLSLRYVPCKQ